MSGFELTASIIGSVAWPLVILVLIVVLRGQIKSAAKAIVTRIADITEVTAPGVSVKLEKQINELAERTEALPDSTPKAASPDEGLKGAPETIAGPESDAPSEPTIPEAGTEPGPEASPIEHSAVVPFETELDRILRYRQLAIEAPNAAILAAFSELEGLVRRNYVVYFDTPRGQFLSFVKMTTTMAREGIISDDAAQVLRELSNVRNEVSHTAVQSSAEAATTYVQGVANAVDYLIGRFEQWVS